MATTGLLHTVNLPAEGRTGLVFTQKGVDNCAAMARQRPDEEEEQDEIVFQAGTEEEEEEEEEDETEAELAALRAMSQPAVGGINNVVG